MTDGEIDRLRRMVIDLQDRVDELEATVNEHSAEETAPNAGSDLDHYDGYVLDKINETGIDPTPRQISQWYNEAGVRNKSKIKNRHRFLRNSGRIKQALNTGESA